MKKYIQFFIAFFILAVATFACSMPSATATDPAPISPEVAQTPPFVGMWMSEKETLVFTQKNLYRVQTNVELGQVNEQLAEIIVYDPQNGHISVRIQWVKVNGLEVGFDTPVYSLSYKIDGDIIQIGLGTESEFTSELSSTIYYRK